MESVEIEKTDQSSERFDGPVDYLGSGGYLEFIYRKLKNDSKEEIKFTPYRRNNDFMETEVEYEGRKVKMAKVYGFRSIQQIVRQIKSKTCKYDYIEVMACPQGCINGGGQIPLKNGSRTEKKAHFDKVSKYFHENKLISLPAGDFTPTEDLQNFLTSWNISIEKPQGLIALAAQI